MTRYMQMMKPGDVVVIAIMVMVIIGSYFTLGLNPAHGEGSDLVIEVRIAGELVYSAPLRRGETPRTVSIPLPRGEEAVLAVTETSVRVLPMPDHLCPRHICSLVMGEISSPGQNIICVPNRLVIELVGSGEPAVDATTR
ncbi:MAG: hypothetical protein DDT27_00247 [Dehalococcoidia bacterium]|nr:hypothetical protein [Chloroflexota bacterium]